MKKKPACLWSLLGTLYLAFTHSRVLGSAPVDIDYLQKILRHSPTAARSWLSLVLPSLCNNCNTVLQHSSMQARSLDLSVHPPAWHQLPRQCLAWSLPLVFKYAGCGEYVRDPSTSKEGGGESAIQFEASLGHMRPFLKKRIKPK